ncbi:hypothetical protein [Nocardiopsis alba]|uniref:hypothetical protein n=1 Tax=Nocardiopsis alba TaxID=53437 RepID=UPI003D72E276
MDNAEFAEFMIGAGFRHPFADLWEIAEADADPEPLFVDPEAEARAARRIAAVGGDLLSPPPAVDDDHGFGWLMAGHDSRSEEWNRLVEAEEEDE